MSRSMPSHASLLFGVTMAFAVASGCEQSAEAPDAASGDGPMCTLSESEEMYDRYIAPIMDDTQSQSCNNCHQPLMLNGWEKADPCQTMACMVEKELVNLENPTESRILEFIDFGRPESGVDIQSEREHDGFMAWIEYGATCFFDACGVMENPCEAAPPSTSGGGPGSGGGGTGAGGSTGSGGVGDGGSWGNCTQNDVQEQFDTLVFPFIDGCKACHEEPGDPEFDNAKRWYHGTDSALTLVDMIGHSGMFDTVDLEMSEIITKPLHMGSVYSNIIDATFVGSEHDGGQKLSPAGENFQGRFDSLTTFVQFFAACHE